MDGEIRGTPTSLETSGLVPAGSVLAFAGIEAPAGYLLCDGTEVSRASYARLFAAIGVAHGNGDGTSTFDLPDYRGRFLRGVASGQSTDPDRASRTAMNTGGNAADNVGSVQGHAYTAHTHTVQVAASGGGNPGIPQLVNWGTDAFQATSSGSAGGGNETRPVNAYVHYIIKV